MCSHCLHLLLLLHHHQPPRQDNQFSFLMNPNVEIAQCVEIYETLSPPKASGRGMIPVISGQCTHTHTPSPLDVNILSVSTSIVGHSGRQIRSPADSRQKDVCVHQLVLPLSLRPTTCADSFVWTQCCASVCMSASASHRSEQQYRSVLSREKRKQKVECNKLELLQLTTLVSFS